MAFDFPNSPTVGQVFQGYTYDGEKWLMTLATPNTSGVIGIQVFTTNGTYFPSASMVTCEIECVGGGGGGGGVPVSTAGNVTISGGGGAGSYARMTATAAQIGPSQVVTIGAAGTGGPTTAGQTGGSGGNTSVGALCAALGGAGGIASTPAASIIAAGGAGGIGGTGTVVANGAPGAPAVASGGYASGGSGGSSYFGGGGRGISNGVGTNGATGGGGAGAVTASTSSGLVGATGGAGLVVITEYGITALGSAATTAGAVRFDVAQGLISTQKAQGRANIAAPLRGWIAGLTLSTAGSSATFGVAAGEAADSTTSDLMQLASAITKTTGTWAVGSGVGALDTGAIAASAWYHVFLIKRLDTGIVDVVISATTTPANGPTVMPSGYTLFRRIGSMKTVASQWALFTQFGDEFLWSIVIKDIDIANFSTTPALYTLANIPSGFQVVARIRINAFSSTIALASLFTSPDEASSAAGSPAGNYNAHSPAGNVVGTSSDLLIRTNTVAQIRGVAASGTTNLLQLITVGWFDRRGRDA
jgi:hypothetical protein